MESALGSRPGPYRVSQPDRETTGRQASAAPVGFPDDPEALGWMAAP